MVNKNKYCKADRKRHGFLAYKRSSYHTSRSQIFEVHYSLRSVLLFHKYDPNNPDMVQIKIADFGLSRDYASTYMTGTLGTYVHFS